MRTLVVTICVITASAILFLLVHTASKHDDGIGHSLGITVYRDDIRTHSGRELADVLYLRFATPVMNEYFEQHLSDIEPTEQELDMFVARLATTDRDQLGDREEELRRKLQSVREQLRNEDLSEDKLKQLRIEEIEYRSELDPPDRQIAKVFLKNWKIQKHLYENYGGGRILFQQAGYEAFDAKLKWLKAQEREGKFAIFDKKLRREFYKYWTEMDHGSFLESDEDAIRDQFLEPVWLRQPAVLH